MAAATTVAGEAAAATSAVVAAAAATLVAGAVAAATSATVAAAAAAAVEATAAKACPRGSRYVFVARALPSRLGFARFALAPHTTIKQHSSGRKRCFGSAATYLPQQ